MRISVKLAAAVAALAVTTSAQAEVLFGLTANNTVVSFDSASPTTITSIRTITGLGGDTLTGLDLRPQDGNLYTVSTTGNIYRLDGSAATYAATLIGSFTGVNDGAVRFGIDFNPAANALRFVNDFDQNFRYAFASNTAFTDGMIAAPGAEALTAVAYTNNFAGTTSTQLFGLDASGNQLLLSSNANAGTYGEVAAVTLNGQALDLGGINNVGFDISGFTGVAYFNLGSSLYSLNLTTAEATSLGTIGAGSLVGLTAAVPEPTTWAMMIGGFGLIGGAMRRRQRMTAAIA